MGSETDDGDRGRVGGQPADSIAFLDKLRPGGPWVLTAIPADGGRTETKTFAMIDAAKLTKWLTDHGAAGNNLYFMVNPARRPLSSKAKKDDVEALEYLHVDIDPAIGEVPEQAKPRALDALAKFVPQPTFVIDSGGGVQAFWKLDGPVHVGGDPVRIADLEPYNRHLEQVLGGDHCFNIDRIMRLPGSVNYPNGKKRAKGRTMALASLLQDNNCCWPLHEFTAAPRVQQKAPARGVGAKVQLSDNLPSINVMTDLPPQVSERTRMLIVHGTDLDDPARYRSTSEMCFAVCCELIRADVADEVVAAILMDRDYGVSEHILKQNRPIDYAIRQIQRARDAVGAKGVRLEDMYAYMPQHRYVFGPTGELWPAGSVNARLSPVPLRDAAGNPMLDEKGKPKTLSASAWLDQNRAVEQMTWCPGFDAVIPDRLVSDGGWYDRPGCNTFNLYRPPVLRPGDAALAGPWLNHVRRVYSDHADHIIKWCAHRVQRPQEKINHALFLGGAQGIGKDTLLEPLKIAVGPWNFAEVSPQHMLGRFNGFVKSVVLRVSEARDLGDEDRFAFYDHMKTYTAAPPDVLRVDEKNLREHAVFNVCGVIITSNHKLDGIYLPADDRRHYVAWSELSKDDFTDEYWAALWAWYGDGGLGHVAAYLSSLDISAFNPKAPPTKTDAFMEIVAANSSAEDADLMDALDQLGRPNAVTLDDLSQASAPEFASWLRDRRNSRHVRHRLSTAGYGYCANPHAQDGRFKVAGRGCAIYTRKGLTTREALQAAQGLLDRSRRSDDTLVGPY